MGRRSINTTKSGKYMNPTDQARKEARKKELKKNKRQRQMVRAAVLKNKDPAQILEEMEKIDEMEYNVMQASPLNEKVLHDKRKKLKETFDRVMRLYHGDEPELWADLKRREVDYEKKRLKKQQYFESVKHAQSVQIDEIPLPQMNAVSGIPCNGGPPSQVNAPPNISIPQFSKTGLPGISKNTVEMPYKSELTDQDIKKYEIPGCPPGPPPDLLEISDLDSDAENDEIVLKEYPKKSKPKRLVENENLATVDADGADIVKPNALQQRMLAISGQNIDEFMKEMENVHKKKEKERQAEENGSSSDENSDSKNSSSSNSESDDNNEDNEDVEVPKEIQPNIPIVPITNQPLPMIPPASLPLLPSGHPPPPSGMHPPMMFRPPPIRPGIQQYGIRMAPGPPSGRLGMPPGMSPRMGLRMPPGPPLGLPPRMMHHHKNQHTKDTKGITTITAKPQIRNLSGDVTRFVPSALRVKREDSQKPRSRPYSNDAHPTQINKRGATKDDAYMVFMNEMQELL